jgi:hypothetical protein
MFVRQNAAGYRIANGQLAEAVKDLHDIINDFPRPQASVYQYLADAEELRGGFEAASQALAQLEKIDATSGLALAADIAAAEGRLADSERILTTGLAKERDAVEIEDHRAMLAEVRLRRGDKAGALAVAKDVSHEPDASFGAGLVELSAGNRTRALARAEQLAREVTPIPHSYALLLQAEDARIRARPDDAIALARKAQENIDQWMGHFILGRALLDAKRYREAKAELDICVARGGEVVVDGDAFEGLRRLPAFYYYRALAEDGLGDRAAAKHDLEAMLAMQVKPDPDPLLDDARARVK